MDIDDDVVLNHANENNNNIIPTNDNDKKMEAELNSFFAKFGEKMTNLIDLFPSKGDIIDEQTHTQIKVQRQRLFDSLNVIRNEKSVKLNKFIELMLINGGPFQKEFCNC